MTSPTLGSVNLTGPFGEATLRFGHKNGAENPIYGLDYPFGAPLA